MSRIAMALCLAWALAQTAAAEPLPVANSLYQEKESAIAFDPDGGRGLVVYAVNGYVYGRYVDGEGRPTAAPSFGIFPVAHPAGGRSYSTPSVSFKRGQNRFVVAAAETETRMINTRDGAIPWTLPSGIATTAFNADGTRAASRFLRTPVASIARQEARPVIVADELDDSCCIAVAWEDQTFSDRFYVQRLDADLTPVGAIAELAAPGADRIANLQGVYELSRDRFTFVYDLIDTASRRFIATTSLGAFTGTSVRHRTIAERSGTGERIDDLPRGTPALAFSLRLDTYVVAWRHADFLRAAFFSPDITGTVSTSFALPTLPCSGLFCFLSPSSTARPALVALPDRRRVVVVAAMTPALGDADDAVLEAYAIDSTVTTSTTPYVGRISRIADGAAVSASAVLSPASGRVLAAWDSAGPTRDAFVGDIVP